MIKCLYLRGQAMMSRLLYKKWIEYMVVTALELSPLQQLCKHRSIPRLEAHQAYLACIYYDFRMKGSNMGLTSSTPLWSCKLLHLSLFDIKDLDTNWIRSGYQLEEYY